VRISIAPLHFCHMSGTETFARARRSCQRRTRPPRPSSTAARRHRSTSTASHRARPASRPPPHSASSSFAMAGTSATNSRRRTPSSPVASDDVSILIRLHLMTDRPVLLYWRTHGRRDCADHQRPQVCVGTYEQHHRQITAKQTNIVIQPRSLTPAVLTRLHLSHTCSFSPTPSSFKLSMTVSIAVAVCALDSE
jgi:hypothetical protein